MSAKASSESEDSRELSLYVWEGESHARVLARRESSPTGYVSLTVGSDGEEAMDRLVLNPSPGERDATLRFYDLESGDLLREAVAGGDR